MRRRFDTYALLKNSHRGTTTVVGFPSERYTELMQTGFYDVLYTGTEDECDYHEEQYLEALNDALDGIAD